MLLFLWLHSQVGKPTLTPSLGHGAHRGKDEVHPPALPQVHILFFLLPSQLLPFPIPITEQLSWYSIPCSLQPGPGAGRHWEHFLPLPVAQGVPRAQLNVGTSEGAQPGHPGALVSWGGGVKTQQCEKWRFGNPKQQHHRVQPHVLCKKNQQDAKNISRKRKFGVACSVLASP